MTRCDPRYVRACSLRSSPADAGLTRSGNLAAGMPSTTSCSETLARNATMCAPSACHRPCVRQRRSPTHPRFAIEAARQRVSSSTACMISSMWMAPAGRASTYPPERPRALATSPARLSRRKICSSRPKTDSAARQWPTGERGDRAMLGEIGHGHDRVPGLGVQLHATSSTAVTPAACGRFLLQSAPGHVLRSAAAEELARNPADTLSNGSKVYRNMKIPSPQVKVSASPDPIGLSKRATAGHPAAGRAAAPKELETRCLS